MKSLKIGLDVGSTTIKIIIINNQQEIIYKDYRRHFSDTKNSVCEILEEIINKYKEYKYSITLTGSGALNISKIVDLHFVQEVIACKRAVEKYIPQTDVVIELGGEDAKIIYFGKSIEQRMNGTCAGGTGAFLDQMATLLNTDSMGLNELAKKYETIYPIASRCGVFAKTDIQPLINEGVLKENIAASIFQAVVNQTISGLACGRPIKGNIAFLGGPLNYLSELKTRFVETLKLKQENIMESEDSHLFVAKGAAMESFNVAEVSSKELVGKIKKLKSDKVNIKNTLPALFINEKDYTEFKRRHSKAKVNKIDLKNYKGNIFLGIDAGSTTTKIVLIDDSNNVLYSIYRSNEGNPLKSVMSMLKEIYLNLPKDVVIRCSGATGYGEKLIEAALNIDISEIETVAHYTAAKIFKPNVTSIIDIGGQDMKYIKIKNGNIDNILLNEACSSGCGSFIETFAKNLNLTLEEFVDRAVNSKKPVDLGSRCTVFMNSKIKEAQKEGYEVGDIASGLSYSVIKNAILKVMKIHDVSVLGDNIVVQGGTFYNDAILRAFEITVNKEVVRPEISGLMGAYGMALLSKKHYENNLDKNYQSLILKNEEIDTLEIKSMHAQCKRCENNCKLTINKFKDNKSFISGNKCEKGSGSVESSKLPNMYKYKYDRVFNYKGKENAKRGKIGIPRVLNIYEDFPFWFTLLTNLNFEVILSDKTTRETYEKGMESMPSESVCYPAKLAHGHIENLIEKGVKTIFYPSVPFARKEVKKAENCYNCPIVISYSEVLKNNMENLKEKNIKFINSFLPFNKTNLTKKLLELKEFKEYKFTKKEIINAINLAEKEYELFKKDVKSKADEYLEYIEKNNLKAIVLAGRPYHLDPEINHGVDSLITSLGLCVLTEDSVINDNKKQNLRVVNQWAYHSRLYKAAEAVTKNDRLELIQLNSFGCGVDAVTTDQVEEILSSSKKMYTLIKIDEVNNLGAIKIRIRSLIASMKKREKNNQVTSYKNDKRIFTKKMKKDYTILMPQMAPIHFELLKEAINSSGYNLELLKRCTNKTVDIGLKYVNNDACYPSILVIGQMIESLDSGEYDVDKTALIISQTGGGCRATNYIGFIRKALKDAGYEKVPVISFNLVGLEKMPGFKITLPMTYKMIKAFIIGDLLQKMLTKNRAYELKKGETENLFNKWLEKSKTLVRKSTKKEFVDTIYNITSDFEKIKLSKINKPKVGIVGEILVKYHPFANDDIVKLLEKEGAEVFLPDFMGFVKFMLTSKVTFNKLLNTYKFSAPIMKMAINYLSYLEKDMKKALAASSKNYLPPTDIWHLEKKIEDVLSIGNQTGEGWFLTAEMIEYIENGIPNIACVQPFACLPNHVVGKGVIKTLRQKYPESNIAPIDYDPGASKANQINRIKLLISIAKDNLK